MLTQRNHKLKSKTQIVGPYLNNGIPNVLDFLKFSKINDCFFSNYFEKLNSKILDVNDKQLFAAIQLILKTNQNKKKLMIFGNGGSAAIASHIAVDFTKAVRIRATNYNEADLITCLSNDFGYQYWVSQAIEFYADKGDIIILISSSGTSSNIINGAKKANEMGLKVISFTGFKKDSEVSKNSNLNFWVDSNEYNIIEMAHHVWLVSIIDYIEELKLQK
ncbi:MAG: hypothetical protein CBD57_00605 [Candidatus Pelagibacter sp. TMED197]|nr:MAG: hypothetical protein CBD57_00605 [Candidatus Pelagibacter sp. TMED197]|tara:strand:- start:878 stop:1534 length:657 start_codon:yes stop_codon:yes gene_type:complete